jgi:DNA-binding response OmpR family regulator/predicted regulator of Ras-like GTPase activity (Roadblock/LC7/MglB family)
MEVGMKRVLIVDDEALFTRSLAEGLPALDPSLEVSTAEDGRAALEALAQGPIDLVVTDLQMPVMDGFELLARMSRQHPEVPVLVMTAFGTAETEARLRTLGLPDFIEKPVDFHDLARRMSEALAQGTRGHVHGITLPTFLQIIEIERKTCTLTVTSVAGEGRLYFREGVLLDAESAGIRGEQAALEMLAWEDAEIDIAGACRAQTRTIEHGLGELMLESRRLKDEGVLGRPPAGRGGPADALEQALRELITSVPSEVEVSIQDKLKELAAVDGFQGVGVFTPTGENLAMLAGQGGAFKSEIGVLANNVLMNAQKSSLEMGTGRGQQVHIEAEKAHILVRCLNEGTDPLKSQPGKAHIHTVLVLGPECSIGMAKMRLNSTVEKMAEDFRM